MGDLTKHYETKFVEVVAMRPRLLTGSALCMMIAGWLINGCSSTAQVASQLNPAYRGRHFDRIMVLMNCKYFEVRKMVENRFVKSLKAKDIYGVSLSQVVFFDEGMTISAERQMKQIIDEMHIQTFLTITALSGDSKTSTFLYENPYGGAPSSPAAAFLDGLLREYSGH